jgi:hypothetical protein
MGLLPCTSCTYGTHISWWLPFEEHHPLEQEFSLLCTKRGKYMMLSHVQDWGSTFNVHNDCQPSGLLVIKLLIDL